jgi:plasmid stability protein
MSADDMPELVPLATRVTEHLRRAVKARAALEGRSVQDLVSQALSEYLTNHGEPESPPAGSAVTPGS